MVTVLAGCEKNFLDTKVDTLITQEMIDANYGSLVNLANAPYVAR
jgi:hypothetical protein